VSEILFREDYIILASQVNQFSDAMNLLKFIMDTCGCYSLPNRDSAMQQRAGQFMSAVISKMCSEPPPNMPYDPENSSLSLLLYILSHHSPVRDTSNPEFTLSRTNSACQIMRQTQRRSTFCATFYPEKIASTS
jgi:hypothetical protein